MAHSAPLTRSGHRLTRLPAGWRTRLDRARVHLSDPSLDRDTKAALADVIRRYEQTAYRLGEAPLGKERCA